MTIAKVNEYGGLGSMAEPDLSKIVGMIMDNPKLIEEIKKMAK